MKRCERTLQFKDKQLRCEFDAGHKGPHFNEDFGCWPDKRPTMDSAINRMLLLVGWSLAAGALMALILWLVIYKR